MARTRRVMEHCAAITDAAQAISLWDVVHRNHWVKKELAKCSLHYNLIWFKYLEMCATMPVDWGSGNFNFS